MRHFSCLEKTCDMVEIAASFYFLAVVGTTLKQTNVKSRSHTGVLFFFLLVWFSVWAVALDWYFDFWGFFDCLALSSVLTCKKLQNGAIISFCLTPSFEMFTLEILWSLVLTASIKVLTLERWKFDRGVHVETRDVMSLFF